MLKVKRSRPLDLLQDAEPKRKRSINQEGNINLNQSIEIERLQSDVKKHSTIIQEIENMWRTGSGNYEVINSYIDAYKHTPLYQNFVKDCQPNIMLVSIYGLAKLEYSKAIENLRISDQFIHHAQKLYSTKESYIEAFTTEFDQDLEELRSQGNWNENNVQILADCLDMGHRIIADDQMQF